MVHLDYVAKSKPELAKKADKAEELGDIKMIEDIIKESVGIIDVAVATGSIRINNSLLTALKSIRFDHQHGQVYIAGATISSKTLITGGFHNATGKTTIGGNTILKSQGTSISIGQGASIVMTGGASIKQT